MKSTNLILLAVVGAIAYFLWKGKGSTGSNGVPGSATAAFKPPASGTPVGGSNRGANTATGNTVASDITNYANTAAGVANVAQNLYNRYWGSGGNGAFNSTPYQSSGDQNFDFFGGSGSDASSADVSGVA